MSDNDSKRLSQERYTQFAENYVSSQTHAKGYDLQHLVALAQAEPSMRLLDIATGGGHTALAFAPWVREVVATDLTPTMLAKAEAHLRDKGVDNASFEVADAEALPFPDASFDLATCRIAPHHFPDVQQFLHECARVLRPGGLLLMQDHVLPEDHDAAAVVDGFERLRDPSHNHAFSRTGWLTMFDRAGFNIEHVEEISKRHEFDDWTKRQGCDAATRDQLIAMLAEASPAVQAWMVPEAWGTPLATFVNHHILIAGRTQL